MNQQRIKEWVDLFLKHIREVTLEKHIEEHEGYKFRSVQHFQNLFNIDAKNIAENIEESLLNNNLVVGAQYFPKRMLVILAENFPEETRNVLSSLFDESKNVEGRLDEAKLAFEKLNDRLNKETEIRSNNTYIGLRFLSLLLSYRFPEKYDALKPAEWKVFARFINPEFAIHKKTPPGEQYNIYLEYIKPLREYLKTRDDIKEIKDKLVEGLAFRDDEYHWITQDVIYVTSKDLARTRAGELVVSEKDKKQDELEEVSAGDLNTDLNGGGTGFMPLEEYLEEYVVRNWNNINFGESLTLYIDEDGAPGQQYTTEVGIIDILAKDSEDNFVVIELKRAESGYKVVGQVLNYMGWVQDNLVSKGKKVRGMIIVGFADKTLKHALKPVSDKISLREYSISMKLVEPK